MRRKCLDKRMTGISQEAATRMTERVLRDLRPERWAGCGTGPGMGEPYLGYYTDDGYGVVTSDDAVFVAGFGLLGGVVPSTDLLTRMDTVNRHPLAGYTHLAPDSAGTWSLMYGCKLPLEYFDGEDEFRFALGMGLYGYEDLRGHILRVFEGAGGRDYTAAPGLDWINGLNVLSELFRLA